MNDYNKAERNFSTDIAAMNTMYALPVNTAPTLRIGQNVASRLIQFKSILTKELSEIDVIIEKAQCNLLAIPYESEFVTDLEVLTDIADLMADLQVYAASEMVKFGIPIDHTLRIVMDSNFSKLGADGLPIKDEEGKFLKGPNYWKPEPQIKEMLKDLRDRNCVTVLKSVN